MTEKIQFVKTTSDKYNNNIHDDNAIYFIEDEGTIYKGDKSFSRKELFTTLGSDFIVNDGELTLSPLEGLHDIVIISEEKELEIYNTNFYFRYDKTTGDPCKVGDIVAFPLMGYVGLCTELHSFNPDSSIWRVALDTIVKPYSFFFISGTALYRSNISSDKDTYLGMSFNYLSSKNESIHLDMSFLKSRQNFNEDNEKINIPNMLTSLDIPHYDGAHISSLDIPMNRNMTEESWNTLQTAKWIRIIATTASDTSVYTNRFYFPINQNIFNSNITFLDTADVPALLEEVKASL